MSKQDQIYQSIQDSVSVACTAANLAEHRFRTTFEAISKRSIDEFRQYDNSDSIASGSIPISVTPEELRIIRESYVEWQAFKLLWDERLEEREFWERYSRKMSWEDKNRTKLRKLKEQATKKIVKLFFYPIVLAAAIIFLIKAF
jgi:hypothetical protein